MFQNVKSDLPETKSKAIHMNNFLYKSNPMFNIAVIHNNILFVHFFHFPYFACFYSLVHAHGLVTMLLFLFFFLVKLFLLISHKPSNKHEKEEK